MSSGIEGNEAELLSVSPRLLEDECVLRYDDATSSITSTSFLYCVNVCNQTKPILVES